MTTPKLWNISALSQLVGLSLNEKFLTGMGVEPMFRQGDRPLYSQEDADRVKSRFVMLTGSEPVSLPSESPWYWPSVVPENADGTVDAGLERGWCEQAAIDANEWAGVFCEASTKHYARADTRPSLLARDIYLLMIREALRRVPQA